MKKLAIRFIGQMIPVMLGVYLGFAMNNFGENQKLKKQKETYQLMLKNEISQNIKGIENVNSYHIQLLESIHKLLESDSIIEYFKSTEFSGLRPGFVSESAYNTGIQTGIIQEFDLNIIQSLNSMYTLQGKYNRFNENMVNSFLAKKYPESKSEIKNMLKSVSISMNDVLIFENELNKHYKVMLEQI